MSQLISFSGAAMVRGFFVPKATNPGIPGSSLYSSCHNGKTLTLLHSERPKLYAFFLFSECNRVKLRSPSDSDDLFVGTPWSFGHSECNRVKPKFTHSLILTLVICCNHTCNGLSKSRMYLQFPRRKSRGWVFWLAW